MRRHTSEHGRSRKLRSDVSLAGEKEGGANLLQQRQKILLDPKLVKVCADIGDDVVDDGAVDVWLSGGDREVHDRRKPESASVASGPNARDLGTDDNLV